jgi:transglutaminase-like putative cysteine protease
MFGALALWVPLLFLGVLALKFWMEPRDYRLRSNIWKLLLGAVTLTAVFVTYGSVRGIEPGVTVVVILMSLKILEAHTAREFQVMANVGWILCLCGFFLSQDLLVALCVLTGAFLLLVALIEFHRGSSTTSFWASARLAGKIILQAIPLIALSFVFFPRTNIGLRLQFPGSLASGSGFSGELSPGSVSALANSSDIAFRAEFPDGKIPKAENLYWRGVVMSQGNGFRWQASPAPASLPRSIRPVTQGPPIRQSITIQPHGNRWMFALDWPGNAPPGSTLAPGNYLWSFQPIRTSKKYNVTSYPEITDKDLHPRARSVLLAVPPGISPAVAELARSWRNGAKNPGDVVSRGLAFFRTQRFRYSLAPGEYRNNDLEEFLFRRRIGFCEHYAASFATLMRLAGIPTRVVVGYLGGEYNEFGHFFIVRQSDAHAWCEVWLTGKGWCRVDPTSVVAPDRVNLGFNAFLERRGASVNSANAADFVGNFARSHVFNTVRLAWQAANYAWDTRVLSFDETAQASLFISLGTVSRDPLSMLTVAMIMFCLAAAFWLSWFHFRKRRDREGLKIFYQKFCDKLERLGAARQLAEGPLDFAMRAGQLLPEKSQRIREVSNLYIALRYSADVEPDLKARFAHEVKMFS